MRLSIIVVAYNMARELPRTIRSMLPGMQSGVQADDYEILVVDNGSEQPIERRDLPDEGVETRVLRTSAPASVSPCRAINAALREARGKLVTVCIDGARIWSPGIARSVLAASRFHDRCVVGVHGFHLGRETQMKSVRHGYDQAVEDRLLEELRWELDPYRLFLGSVYAGSSAGGWISVMAESCALTMPADLWHSLGCYDESFESPGGGLCNLDIWKRACERPETMPVTLLGEGTFHQVHGGAATNAAASPWKAFHDEYRQLRNADYSKPEVDMFYFGALAGHALAQPLHPAGASEP